jgi:hypothetical protein
VFLLASVALAQPPRPLRERLLERALKGEAEAQFDLGKNYEAGRIGLPKDFVQAEHWYRMAAEQGEPFAQASLGILYGFGKGIPRDLVQAYMWYELGASLTAGGDRVTIAEMRDDLAAKMTPQQIAEAKQRVRDWKPKAGATQVLQDEQEVLAAMEVYRNAMVTRDGVALEKVLGSDLAYVHSGGEVETKQDVIDAIVKVKTVVEKIEFSGSTVRLYGNTALVRGRVDLWHSPTNIVHMNVLHVWIKGASGWQLQSRQATRLAK